MKIVHAYKDFTPPLMAGITRYISMVAGSAVERGHEVEVVVAGVRNSRREVLSNGVVVHRVAEHGRAMSNPLSPELALAVRGIRADVLHLHMPNPLSELGALGQVSPIVATFHAQLGRSAVIEALYRPLQQAVLRKSSAVLVSSPAMALAPELAAHRDRVSVLPYGVDRSLVGESPVTRRDGDPLRLLFVGRLVHYKGLDVLLDAMSGLGGPMLTIIGEGPLAEHVATRIEASPQLAATVRLVGAVTDAELARAYREHHVLVAPSISRAEAFGISLAEAVSNGLPAVSSALGTGTDWVNEDGRSGIVVPPSDPEALRQAIIRLEDENEWARLSAGAWNLGRERFSADAHFEKLLGHYERAAR